MRSSTILRSALLVGSLALLGARCGPAPGSSPSPAASPGGAALAPAPPVATAGGGLEVATTAAGFLPAVLEITPGTTVTFRNTDTNAHWVASDPHPLHTGLPGFDARRPLAPGEFYRFTFTTLGTHGYHDHLNPGLRGVITIGAATPLLPVTGPETNSERNGLPFNPATSRIVGNE